MVRASRVILGIVLLALVGCAPASPPRPAGLPAQTERPAAPKVLTIALQTPKEGFAPWFIQGHPGPLQWEDLHTNFLVSGDSAGTPEPWLAAQLPTLKDQSLEILPDGRLKATWKLRPNVKWQDGQAFTADDVLFGWQVVVAPGYPGGVSPTARGIQTIEVSDPLTAVMISRAPSPRAIQLGYRDLWPLPRHLLGEAFRGSMDAFAALPFWTTEYVHTGPFRVKEFVPGDHYVLERFDDYFMGRPKLDRVIVRVIPDNAAVVSNMLAGAVDVAGELPTEMAVHLRDQWQQNNGGSVISRQAFWRFISIQFHPEWGGPPELQQDVRTRRGLALTVDNDSLRAVVVPGFPDTESDTFMLKADPRASVVGRPFARFKYDAAAGLREFADAGWRRAADGRLLNAAGEQVRLHLRVALSDIITDLSVVARGWRELGFDVTEDVTPAALRRDNEHNVKFPGMEITAQGPQFWRRFDSRQRPTPENRYAGNNGGSYVHPAFDRLIDRIETTLDDTESALILKEMGELMAADLPALPMYFSIRTVVILRHVRGLDDIYGAPGQLGTTAKNAYQWDRTP